MCKCFSVQSLLVIHAAICPMSAGDQNKAHLAPTGHSHKLEPACRLCLCLRQRRSSFPCQRHPPSSAVQARIWLLKAQYFSTRLTSNSTCKHQQIGCTLLSLAFAHHEKLTSFLQPLSVWLHAVLVPLSPSPSPTLIPIVPAPVAPAPAIAPAVLPIAQPPIAVPAAPPPATGAASAASASAASSAAAAAVTAAGACSTFAPHTALLRQVHEHRGIRNV